MMKAEIEIGLLTFVLSATAGFCDALTYVSANGLFSAHVTGNFILFATNMVNRSSHDPWIKLLTFPVFIISVIAGGIIGKKSSNSQFLLLVEGILLIITGIIALVAGLRGLLSLNWPVYGIAMMIVCSMGIQNAFGKLFSAATYGPTTMMTGNVTQWSLDLKNIGLSRLQDTTAVAGFKKISLTITGFLLGCLAGSLAGKFIGLGAVLFAGIAMMGYYAVSNKK